MQYNITSESKLQQIIKKLNSKCEDIILAAAIRLASFFKSQCLMNWVEQYTMKKIERMKSEIIKQRWNKVTLDKALDSIHEQQSSKIVGGDSFE